MIDEPSVTFDTEPAGRAVSVRWVWPGRWLLTVGDDVSTVLTGAELVALAAEMDRESGRRGGGKGV